MRILILFDSDRVFKPGLLELVLQTRYSDVIGVGAVQAKGKRRPVEKLQRDLSFWGFGGAFSLVRHQVGVRIQRLILPQGLRHPSSLEEVSSAYSVPFEQVEDVNEEVFVRRVRENGVDVILSFQHQIFREELLQAPRICCLNCHPGALPDYRGVKPIFWAMLHREKEIGVTVHSMVGAIDGGLVVAQRRFVLRPGDTLLENYRRAYLVAGPTILEALDRVEHEGGARGSVIPLDASYFSHPTLEDVAEFRRLGLRMC